MTRKGRTRAYLCIAMFSAGPTAARAAPLQLIGELSVTNSTAMVPGGKEFTLSVFDPSLVPPDDLWGQTVLVPAFWPELGQTFSGPFEVDIVSSGSGLIHQDPLRIDGVEIILRLEAPTGIGNPFAERMWATTRPEALGVPETLDLRILLGRDPPYYVVGQATLQVDAIVPEPGGGVMALLLMIVGLRTAGPRRPAPARPRGRSNAVLRGDAEPAYF